MLYHYFWGVGWGLGVWVFPSDSPPDSKVHGANMGPTWVLSAPDGPHVGPMNLALLSGSGLVRMLDASCAVCNNLLFVHSFAELNLDIYYYPQRNLLVCNQRDYQYNSKGQSIEILFSWSLHLSTLVVFWHLQSWISYYYTYYTNVSAITHLPMMFLSSDLLWEYRIELVKELACVVLSFPYILQACFQLCKW